MNSTHYIYVSAFAITIAIEIVINDDDFPGTVPHVSFGHTLILQMHFQSRVVLIHQITLSLAEAITMSNRLSKLI